MFADSLLNDSWAERSRRGWTTLISFALETVAISGLLLLPLLYTQGLPQLQLMSALVAATPPPPPAAMAAQNTHPSASNVSSEGHVIAPRVVPMEISNVEENTPPPPVDAGGLNVPGGTGNPMARNSVLNSIGTGLNTVLPPPPKPSPYRPRVSRMMEGNLISRVQPQYPALARQARVQGVVVLRAVISRNGRIENLQVVSGHPLLVKSAEDAVQQWRYRPYYLNNEPVEVETQVTVNFTLSGG